MALGVPFELCKRLFHRQFNRYDAINMGYSARVEGWLRIDDQLIEWGQLGPEWLILRDSVAVPARNGEIIIRIDDREDRFPVFLPNGVDPKVTKTRYEKLEVRNYSKLAIQQQFGWISEP